MHHTYPMDHGAAILPDGDTRFRIWAPSVAQMSLLLEEQEQMEMHREAGDWFCIATKAPAGTRYQFVLPDGLRVPDPTARRQEGSVHGCSIVVDPTSYDWQNNNWHGRPWHETVLYELHPGTMGGFKGITERLPFLAETGITAIELMPVAEFPGARNWGYDGVLPYAPDSSYGTPDDLKHMIDTAHGLGIMVFLDVVYNHFGPDGAYIHIYAKSFFSEDFHTPWGAGIDFRRTVVQEYFIHNALYWLREYRFDGLRFDALGVIQPQSFLTLLANRIRDGVESSRFVHLVMEHEHNAASLLRGCYDAQWTDDVHHALHVLLTDETFGYYEDFEDAANLLARSLKDGFSYQGELSRHSGSHRGEPSGDLPATCFVVFDQNHDQIGNRAVGDRMTSTVDATRLRVARSFLLLSPFIPLLFMGQEWATRTPFQFFTDHHAELAELVRTGRRTEFNAFMSGDADAIPDPNDITSFTASMLDYAEPEHSPYREELAHTKALLALRAAHITPRNDATMGTRGIAIGPKAVLGEWEMQDGSTLRLAMNLGPELVALEPTDLPLLHESAPGVGQSARTGTLQPNSIAVWLSALRGDLVHHA